ncbi:hypothetical protein PIB30_050092 [Stylosanthes scabra]|uniref:Uncharacterized protein n=1 Tax=Stylosanthes scabra TaxID=79078 RepID=A0ABU6YJB4_9FABA|nr:hypothetical protein [Stylosanthes scabra]
MVISEDELTKLYRIRKTLLQMLRDRGYLVGEFEINKTKDEFKKDLGEFDESQRDIEKALVMSKCKKDNPSDQIYVFFPKAKKIGVATLREYTSRMNSANVYNAILIYQENLTSYARQSITEMANRFRWELFQEKELLINITKHQLIPEHRVLTDAEKKTLLERYTVKETQLPKIQVNDPVARYYALRHGQVVKIIRPSETAGRYVTYRVVV